MTKFVLGNLSVSMSPTKINVSVDEVGKCFRFFIIGGVVLIGGVLLILLGWMYLSFPEFVGVLGQIFAAYMKDAEIWAIRAIYMVLIGIISSSIGFLLLFYGWYLKRTLSKPIG